MLNNGINFGMDGPQITGWWVNPQTGDKFNAVDSFFEDNNLVIKTADGRFLNYNQIQNYIQTNDSGSAPSAPINSIPNHIEESIPTEILNELEDSNNANLNDLLIPDDDILGLPKGGVPDDDIFRIPKGGVTLKLPQQPVSKINDFDIIDRALKDKGSITIKGDICWKDFPEREIEMLIDVMNISENDIIEYYINNITLDDVLSSIKDSIKSHIYSTLHKSIKGSSSRVSITTKEVENDFIKKDIVKKPKTIVKRGK